MASMRDIKRRKSSITSTQQITKAMKLVSTVKLQKARSKAESSKPYSNFMYETVRSILAKSTNVDHKYLHAGASGKKAVIMMTSNRGLAGGYNSNITKMIIGSGIPKEEMIVYPIGRKGRDTMVRKGYAMATDYSDVMNEPLYKDAMDISEELLQGFENGEISEIYLAYTSFKNTVSQTPKLEKLLPVTMDASSVSKEEQMTPMNYEPNEEEVLDHVIPKYMTSLIYGALLECVASENGARMTAMDAATSNAEEMIDTLSLEYNRARQGSITQELTEIIAGAQAIS
ncbi:MAG: ATP synthase F1 subunit gamma [Clostridiales bacterium]|nr:ATP synthase F1 subunit gamma [Clostridiales bacterium]